MRTAYPPSLIAPTVSTKAFLVSKNDIRDEKSAAKKEQKFIDNISIEVEVLNYGADYWNTLCEVANSQGVINGGDFQLLKLA